MIELIRQRRSRRVFTQKPISPSVLKTLKEVLLRSPTSRNQHPWRFWIVQDKTLLASLSQSKNAGSKLIKGAPLAVVIGADSDISDVWVEDCSIAAILLQMTGESLGLGSCWVQIRLRESLTEGVSSEDYVKKVLGEENNKNLRIASIIALGYPDEEKKPVPYEDLLQEKIIEITG